MKWARLWSVNVIFAVLTGCASIPEEVASLDGSLAPVELVDTPFFAQEQYQCGPAALATVLVQSGIATSAEALVPQVYVPARQGSFQPELLAATRAANRIPYVINPALSAIHAELTVGRPVLVLQNLGLAWLPRWHYAVVVGVAPARGQVYLRSGTDLRRETSIDTFLRTWRRGDFWAFVVLQPGELPAQPDAMRYAQAVAAADSSVDEAAALLSWRAAARQWPDHSVILFGLANAELAAGNFLQAETYYRQMLLNQPNNLLAANNLALALAQQGKHAQAAQQIDSVIRQVDADDPLKSEFLDTQQEIRQMHRVQD